MLSTIAVICITWEHMPSGMVTRLLVHDIHVLEVFFIA